MVFETFQHLAPRDDYGVFSCRRFTLRIPPDVTPQLFQVRVGSFDGVFQRLQFVGELNPLRLGGGVIRPHFRHLSSRVVIANNSVSINVNLHVYHA